jgi:hypothetical protein
MIRYYTTLYCQRCEQIRRFTKRGMENRPHLIATIFTLGLWGIPWLAMARRSEARPWRCCICHKHQKLPRGTQFTTAMEASAGDALVGELQGPTA